MTGVCVFAVGFVVGFAAVWVSRGSRCPDPVSAAQTQRSGFRLGFSWASLPRSGLSSLSAAPDPVSAGEEKAVAPDPVQLEMWGIRWCWGCFMFYLGVKSEIFYNH
uniref:Uncharacterized protein n=1 Tax=Fagus sylvatica TaxID=28930 RepID=A0A2N9IHQ1_FAGSY